MTRKRESLRVSRRPLALNGRPPVRAGPRSTGAWPTGVSRSILDDVVFVLYV